jgi:hypothetical protein
MATKEDKFLGEKMSVTQEQIQDACRRLGNYFCCSLFSDGSGYFVNDADNSNKKLYHFGMNKSLQDVIEEILHPIHTFIFTYEVQAKSEAEAEKRLEYVIKGVMRDDVTQLDTQVKAKL